MSVTLDSGIIATLLGHQAVGEDQPLVGGDEPVVAPLQQPPGGPDHDQDPEPPQHVGRVADRRGEKRVQPEGEDEAEDGGGDRFGDLGPVLVHRSDDVLAVEQVAPQHPVAGDRVSRRHREASSRLSRASKKSPMRVTACTTMSHVVWTMSAAWVGEVMTA